MISDIKKYLYYLLWILIIKCFEKGLAHVRRAASSQVPSTHLSKGNNKDIARGAPALKKQAHSFSMHKGHQSEHQRQVSMREQID